MTKRLIILLLSWLLAKNAKTWHAKWPKVPSCYTQIHDITWGSALWCWWQWAFLFPGNLFHLSQQIKQKPCAKYKTTLCCYAYSVCPYKDLWKYMKKIWAVSTMSAPFHCYCSTQMLKIQYIWQSSRINRTLHYVCN